MKTYDEIEEGKILYLARTEEFWNASRNSQEPDGTISQYTKVKVDDIDGSEVYFEILEGEFRGENFMWGWYDSSDAKPEELLTEAEFDEINIKEERLVNEENFQNVIEEIELKLSGTDKQKYIQLINFMMQPRNWIG